MGRKRTAPSDHPLMQGGTVKLSVTVPEAMLRHLREISLDDRVPSLSEYVTTMLLRQIELRELEREKKTRR